MEVYFSPNKFLPDFEKYMDGVCGIARKYLPRPVIVLGNMNIKSVTWGSFRTDRRREVVKDCLAACGLIGVHTRVHQSLHYTCVRRAGGSVIDVAFVSRSARGRVSDGRIKLDMETLSDYRYVTMRVSVVPGHHRSRQREASHLRGESCGSWTQVSAAAQVWPALPAEPRDLRTEVRWLREICEDVCDTCMPRFRDRRSGGRCTGGRMK